MWFLTWGGNVLLSIIYVLLSIIYFYVLVRVLTRAVIRSIHEHERNEQCPSSAKGSVQTKYGKTPRREVVDLPGSIYLRG